MGSTSGMESRMQVWTGKGKRSVSHPDGLTGVFKGRQVLGVTPPFQ